MTWRQIVMRASMQQPLLSVLDRCGQARGEGPEATQLDASEDVMTLDLRRYGLYTFDGRQCHEPPGHVLLSQGDWRYAGTLAECCARIAARHPVDAHG